jgi:hypothetical protein
VLLSNHPRHRLFVPPLLWNHRQPALLQCRFLPPEPAPRLSGDQEIPMPTPPFYGPIDTTDVARRLESAKDPFWKGLKLRDLLMTKHPNGLTFFDKLCYPPTICHAVNRVSAFPRSLKLRFQRKPLGEVPYLERTGSFNRDDYLSSPMIALLHRSSIQFFREKASQPDWRYRNRRFKILRRRHAPPEYMPDPSSLPSSSPLRSDRGPDGRKKCVPGKKGCKPRDERARKSGNYRSKPARLLPRKLPAIHLIGTPISVHKLSKIHFSQVSLF